jgi:hypothetical protein
MADEAEDVLELDELEVIEDEDTDAAEPEVDTDADGEGEGEETVIGFEGEEEDEAAPASESESSVIREMRRKLREQERELSNLRKGQQPAKVEIGPKPTLESCEYDEERFENELDAWKARKAKADAQAREAEEAEERQATEWQETVKTYRAASTQLGVAGYEEAEAEVFSVLPNEVQALILRQRATAPALVYALSRSPSKLEELSKLNLADAAVMVGELKAKVKVEKRRKLPDPDKPVSGRAGTPSAANLERLRDKARKSGNWDDYFAAKRAAGA